MKSRIFKAILILLISIMYGCATSSKPPLEMALNDVFSNQDNKELADNINFPAKMALLANGHKTSDATTLSKDWIKKIVESADHKGELSRLNLTKEQTNNELDSVFVTRSCPEESLDSDEIRGKIIQLAIDEGLGNFGVTPEEAREAIEIIESGQFYRDISSSVIAVAKILPDLANKLIINPPELSSRFHSAIGAIKNDFKDNGSAIDCINKLKTGEFCNEPKVLQHTLKILYETPTIDVAKETVNVLLEKESIRIAIILYARSNGIDIDKEDINAIQDILTESDPELGKFFTIAINRMVNKYGMDETKIKLETMANNSNCSSVNSFE